MEPLISVIVPVYNTRPYLKRCVESLLAQTWPRLEIILVDDGSPDGAGAVCDAYAARDPRVRVIHQENRGLAAARNAGLAAAEGELIAWTDSDDWMLPGMLTALGEGLLESGCGLALCGCLLVSERGAVPRLPPGGVLTAREALGLLYRGELQNWVWNKLAPRELYRGITFPEGEDFEDIRVMDRLFARAGRILSIPRPLCCYRQRGDSIAGSLSLEKKLALCRAARERCSRVLREDPGFSADVMGGYLIACTALGEALAAAAPEERRRLAGEVEAALDFLARRRALALEGYPGRAGGLKLRLLLSRRPWAWKLLSAVTRRRAAAAPLTSSLFTIHSSLASPDPDRRGR